MSLKMLSILVVYLLIGSLTIAQKVPKLVYNSPIKSYECPGAQSGAKALKAMMTPCADTPGCVMPDCCGVVAGELTIMSFTYTATMNVTEGIAQGQIVGVTLTAGHKDLLSGILKLINPLKFVPVTIPNLVVAYSYDMCYKGPKQDWNVDFCPQVIGNNYTYECYFMVPTRALTTSVCRIIYLMTCQLKDYSCTERHRRVRDQIVRQKGHKHE